MDRGTVAATVLAVVMSVVGIVGDYFLKRASSSQQPLLTSWFVVGLVLYSSTAFAWVFVMRYLNLAAIGVVYSVSMILLLSAMGVLFFDERLGPRDLLGIALAIAGVSLLARFA